MLRSEDNWDRKNDENAEAKLIYEFILVSLSLSVLVYSKYHHLISLSNYFYKMNLPYKQLLISLEEKTDKYLKFDSCSCSHY